MINISELPNTFLGWAGFMGLIAAGLFAAYGIFDAARRRKNDLNDKADDRLINILKGTVEELEKKVDFLVNREKELTLEVAHLTSKNTTLVEVLQGRDQEAVSFYKSAGESMGLAKQTHETVIATSKNVERLASLIEQHMVNIEQAAKDNAKVV